MNGEHRTPDRPYECEMSGQLDKPDKDVTNLGLGLGNLPKRSTVRGYGLDRKRRNILCTYLHLLDVLSDDTKRIDIHHSAMIVDLLPSLHWLSVYVLQQRI
jgi:hypothetical protein